tara:strand:+ start:2254 stop:2541 length:288 start_codon:yes stop_codon:yes gene_type:complete
MFNINVAQVGNVNVSTSNEGGLTDEQISELALEKICKVSETAPEPIKQQALAYKDNLKQILLYYVKLAKKEERATIVNILDKNCGNEIANIIRRL